MEGTDRDGGKQSIELPDEGELYHDSPLGPLESPDRRSVSVAKRQLATETKATTPAQRILLLLAAIEACADNLPRRYDDRPDRHISPACGFPRGRQGAPHILGIERFHEVNKGRCNNSTGGAAKTFTRPPAR